MISSALNLYTEGGSRNGESRMGRTRSEDMSGGGGVGGCLLVKL